MNHKSEHRLHSKFISHRLRLKSFAALLVTFTAAKLPVLARAQENALVGKQIRIVAGFSPGGSVDALARTLADALQKSSGASVIVENKPGAGGNIAAKYVASSTGDTINLLLTSTNHYANKELFREPGYDAYRDFVALNHLSNSPHVFIVPVESSLKSLTEFVARGRADSGKLSWAFGGNGTPAQFMGMSMEKTAKFKGIPVAYRGGPDLLTAVVGKQVDLAIMTLQTALPFIQQGKVRAIAISGATRNKLLPELATAEEQIPGYPRLDGFTVLMAASKIPGPILTQLQREIYKAQATDAFQQRLDLGGSSFLKFASVAESKAHFDKDGPRWEALVREAGLKVE
jgi:tripartite-type tricarboxylate transporter receptor subunit TctC